MSGPELQANAIWTAMHGLPLRSAPPFVDLLVTLLLALVPVALASRLSVVAASLLSACAGVAFAITAQLAFEAGTIVAVVTPLTGLALATVLAIVASHAAESGARRREHDRAEELEARVRERTAELRQTQLEIVQRLAQAADSRDEETGEHIERIGRLCADLGLAVGLGNGEAELLRHAAAMHDVGKIGIPDRVLLKAGKLDAEEWELMKTHTTLGAQILSGSRSELLQLAETIALTHHERWDGSGYPAGLAGEEIPLVGRICAVCDVFDALISERPYKRAWSRREALAEIARGSGSHFDPRLADAFLAQQRGRADTGLDEWMPAALADIRPNA
jgi:response regulator RpfG family c-di-GMP phosphodiesterase